MPQINKILATGLNGQAVWMSASEADLLTTLEACNKGGVAGINGYVATSKRVTPEVANYQAITIFSNTRRLERAKIQVSEVSFADCNLDTIPDTKLKGQTRQQWFDIAKGELLASATKTLENDRSDAHRQGHDRCYTPFHQGVKAHLVTERVDGIMQPVLTDGYPTVESIKLSVLILNKTVVSKGEYKPVNSGAKVLAKNAINKVLNQRSIGVRTLSLKAGNFDSLHIAKNVIISEDIKGLMD
jgi:hypothetical protein